MNLLRNDDVVALNALIVAAETLQARLTMAAERESHVDRHPQPDLARRLVDELEPVVARLMQHVRDSGDIPAAPSDELHLVDAGAFRLRLSLGGAEVLDDVLGEWLSEYETAIETHATQATQAGLEVAALRGVAAELRGAA